MTQGGPVPEVAGDTTDVAQSQASTQDCGARDGVTQGGPVPEVVGDTTDVAQSQAST